MKTGIYCIDDIRERCFVDRDTGCWRWGMAMSRNSFGATPICYLPALDRQISVRRAILHFQGVPLQARTWAACFEPGCCSPKHLVSGTNAEYGHAIKATGFRKGNLKLILANTRAAQKRAKAPPFAEEIVASPELGTVIAKRLGLSESTISRYRRRAVRRVSVASNVFEWRP